MSKNPLKVAIIHDELVRRGGAERVLEDLLRTYPQADLYALYAGNTPKMTLGERTYPIHTSSLQKWPLWFRKHPGHILPFLPQAVEQFDVSTYDLVISSSSAFAKGVITRSNVPHLCYCHTPTRYLWDATTQVLKKRKMSGFVLAFLFHFLRMVDFAFAQRPTAYIANSQYTARRIHEYYKRPSTVVYPAIDTTYFTPASNNPQRDYFLCVGRLTPEKRFDHAIAVAEKLGVRIVIAGTGKDRARLEKLAGKYTAFVGKVSQEELRELYRNARAVIQPGIEDFGMASVEALACGTPVIAYGKGGITEIMRNGVHGILYAEQLPESLAEAMRQFIRIEKSFNPGNLQQQARQFSFQTFQQGIQNQVEYVMQVGNT